MPRRARLDAPGTLRHVMVRGIERGKIVNDDTDREYFISLRFDMRLAADCMNLSLLAISVRNIQGNGIGSLLAVEDCVAFDVEQSLHHGQKTGQAMLGHFNGAC